MKPLLDRIFTAILLAALFVYRYAVSPVIHMLAPGCGCRFTPSCSEYAAQALRLHGPLRGTLLAARRFLKCHPWGDWGYDPVPPQPCSCPSRSHPQHPPSFSHPKPSGSGSKAASG